jgi:cell division protein FtsB
VRRLVAVLILGAALALYALWALPTRTLLEVHSDIGHAQVTLSNLEHQIKGLEHSVHQLNTPGYLDWLARNVYGMYPKGAVPYQVLPSSPLYAPPRK